MPVVRHPLSDEACYYDQGKAYDEVMAKAFHDVPTEAFHDLGKVSHHLEKGCHEVDKAILEATSKVCYDVNCSSTGL
jgi:hypothetical protein